MTMIERVARALWEVSAEPEHGDSWEAVSASVWGDNLRQHARAVIKAMREPSEAMVDQGYEPIRFTEVAGHLDAKRCYQAFIDAALSEAEHG